MSLTCSQDLRVYTIWRAEVAHFKAQHLPYRKTGTEWEILGELAQRLHHKEESKDAFQRALDQKFSAKAWLKLLEMYADEGDVQRSLNAAIRLSVYQHRWYMEMSVSSYSFPVFACSSLMSAFFERTVSDSCRSSTFQAHSTRWSCQDFLLPCICTYLFSSRHLSNIELTDRLLSFQMNVPQAILKGVMQPVFSYAQQFHGTSIK